MHLTVSQVSSHLCKILRLIIVKTYLQIEETPSHCSTHSYNMLRLIHMQPSTDTNTSSQWSCLHKNIIFLVIILILKHVLFRVMQEYLSPVIIVFYAAGTGGNPGVAATYGCIMQYYPLLMKTVIKIIINNKMIHFRFGQIWMLESRVIYLVNV